MRESVFRSGLRRAARAVVALVVLCGGSACTTAADDCPEGSRGCACAPTAGCESSDLSCVDNVCVRSGTVSSGGSSSGGNTSAAGNGSGGGSTSEGGNTSGGTSAGGSTSGGGTTSAGGTTSSDDCAAADGERTPDGACYKQCVYDSLSPGGDLYDDCTALRQVCGEHGYCVPSGLCDTDADCGDGWHCQPDYAAGICTMDCTSGTCPDSGDICVSSCPPNDNLNHLPSCFWIGLQTACGIF